MKRILLAFFMFSMLLLFIGCSNNKTNTSITEDEGVVADISSEKTDETGENEEQNIMVPGNWTTGLKKSVNMV